MVFYKKLSNILDQMNAEGVKRDYIVMFVAHNLKDLNNEDELFKTLQSAIDTYDAYNV